jgi:predicted DCC family thiol-disulfide oxidoreductase YuxK
LSGATFTGMHSEVVLLFDGVCNLCNGVVQFLIRQDKKGILKFASLQSHAAAQRLHGHGDLKKLTSVVLIEKGQVFQKSNAVLKVVQYLPWYWQWAQVFWIVPRFIRDGIYDWIARNRYQWFGKRDTCIMPTPELKERFLN